jgi:hypothetical protein
MEIQVCIYLFLLGTLFAPAVRYYRKAWPLGWSFQAKLHLSILRTSKRVHGIAKDVLDKENKWIVFDIEDATTFHGWVGGSEEYHMIDHDNAAALPIGIMRVRVKSVMGFTSVARLGCRHWPASMPQRQIFLVAAENLLKFLLKLRTVEFMTGIRVMPRQNFTDVDNT